MLMLLLGLYQPSKQYSYPARVQLPSGVSPAHSYVMGVFAVVSRPPGAVFVSSTPVRLVLERPAWIAACSSSSKFITFSPGQTVLLVSRWPETLRMLLVHTLSERRNSETAAVVPSAFK